jgi:hypothetical protein
VGTRTITDPVPDPDVFYGKPIDVPEGTRVGIKVCVDNTGVCSDGVRRR